MAGCDIANGAASSVTEASPLDATFSGEATVAIPELHVSESRKIELGLRFSADRRRVDITSFPPIETKRYNTPLGGSRSTVSLRKSSPGTFDPQSGAIAIEVTLHFDQSLDVPMVNEDADTTLVLKTDAAGGSALDSKTGQITLAATGSFQGKGGVNPLRGKSCEARIAGTLSPPNPTSTKPR